ncbi:MAG: PAS domain S-box protein [Nitrospinota bacterium]|nr:PAS domain S-box protein [Nitrospinota bacterium]
MKKRFATTFLSFSTILSIFFWSIYYTSSNARLEALKINEMENLETQIELVSQDVSHIFSDLIYLSEQHELAQMIEGEKGYDLTALEGDLRTFSKRKGLYEQIRIIDATGNEIVRINYNDGDPEVLPKEKLQYKGDRYYFKETLKMNTGEIYISPFDLNVEKGQIEKPFKPMIRVGTPLYNRKGEIKGIVFLNYLGKILIANIKDFSKRSKGRTSLLNQDGYWLVGENSEDEWGFMLEARKNKRYEAVFPDAWKKISEAESGQFMSNNELFSFITVYPLMEDHVPGNALEKHLSHTSHNVADTEYYWKIVNRIPEEVLDGVSTEQFSGLLNLYGLLLVLFAAGSWVEAKANQKEKNAAEEMELYRMMIEKTGDPVFLIDDDDGCRMAYVNEAAVKHFGATKEEILRWQIPDWDPNFTFEKLPEHVEEIKKVQNLFIESIHRVKSGELVPVEISLNITNYKNRLCHFGYFKNISERKRAEASLKKMSKAIETLEESIIITDMKGFIEYVNPSCEKITGYTEDELLGKNPRIFKSGLESKETYEEMWKMLSAGRVWRGELVNKRKNGELYNEEMTICPILDDGGNVTNFVAIKRDISKRKLAEKELREAKEQAERATILKDKFVSLVAHDLRSPFNSIIGFLKIVQKKNEEPIGEKKLELVKRVISVSEGMLKMIEDLLNISRLNTGELKPVKYFLDASAISAGIIENISYSAEDKGIVVANNIPKGTRIYADPALIRETIHNLVSNSIKFCDKGGLVEIYMPEAGKPSIAVKDNGVGIDNEYIEKLFRHGEKTTSPGTRGEKGTGLGLPFSYDIVKAHDGSLDVVSKKGEGSIFVINLPYVRPRILIVEDDPGIRGLIKQYLNGMDVEFLEAENGTDALEMLKKETVHLLITDLFMEKMDGLALIKQIKQNHKWDNIRIIVVTASNDAEKRQEVFSLGADDFINKPIHIDEFVPRVKRFVL